MFQNTGEDYSPPPERLAVQVQLSRRKWTAKHNIYAAPIQPAGITDTLDFACHLPFLGDDLNAHSPLWDINQPSDTRGEQLKDWVVPQSPSVLNDGAATLLNRATGGLSSPEVSQAHLSLADKTELSVSEDLGSDHLPITIELRCQTPVTSDPHRRARWNTRDVNWQAFSEVVKESVRSFQVQDMHLRIHIRRLNRAMISAAAKHVGKSKPYKKTRPWSAPALLHAIKQHYILRRTAQSNRVKYLAACGEVRRLSEDAHRKKWEKFLADLEGNPDPVRAWNLIKSLLGSPHPTAFCEPLIHNGTSTNTGKAKTFVQQYVAVH